MLTRLFSLREELCTFLSQKKPELADFFNDDKWLLQLSYLADIFSEVNKLNKAMQGANTNNISQYKKVEAFKRKLKLWRVHTSSGITDMFENMHAFIQDRGISFNVVIAQVTFHLSKLLEKFNSYFPELTEEQAASYQWIENPFIENIEMKLPEASVKIIRGAH
ncbi:SCAN domain-containing protein 3 [Chionoecetes opilio]|uniref:SCAN domain-containing protein 3 n=1 Tax=Chionoecetes opilio TaxID=41210 RepID=A0A8J4Y362_CHIOP|nr:SCAN domain-containing protein 3 [Chionoecetes opilio]